MKYEIGERIRKFREKRNLNQKDLAEMIGVSNSRISNWEQGINRPSADIVADLCRALKISPSELLDVHLVEECFTTHEKNLIYAYREKKDLQHAVNILLDVEEKE